MIINTILTEFVYIHEHLCFNIFLHRGVVVLNANCRELLVNEHKHYHLKAFMAIRGPFMVIHV